MPQHDHSIVRHMVAGDLNTNEALWLWNCPITSEELDIWHHINEAFDMFETLEKGWIQDKNYLGEGVAAELFDSNCLEGAMSFARKKHFVRLMAIMDHFGYYTYPLREHEDPLWYNKEDFLPWLEHMKDKKRLHIIKHPSIAGEFNKRLSCTEKKIKSKLAEVKLEEGESSYVSPPKRKSESKKKAEKKKRKSAKATSEEPQTQPEPVVKTEVTAPSGEKAHPTTAGKSPRDFSKIPSEASAGGSDIDTDSSGTDDQ